MDTLGSRIICLIILISVPTTLQNQNCSVTLRNYNPYIIYKLTEEEVVHYYTDRTRFPPLNQPISIICTNVTLDGTLNMGILNGTCENKTCDGEMTIKSSSVPLIPESAFSNFSFLAELYLKDIGIEELSPGAFNSLSSLKGLYLSGNNLVAIPDGVFNSLKSLKILDLSSNNISKINLHAFAGLNLELLSLSRNALVTFNCDILSEVIKIKRLILSYNRFRKFSFKHMNKVATLELNDNYLEDVDGCFAPLIVLFIHANRLTNLDDITCFNETSNMIDIYLSGNFITTLNRQMFSTIKPIHNVYLHCNDILEIQSGSFSDLKNLQVLNLSSNSLQDFDYGVFDSMQQLKTLDISSNNLTTFEKSTYHSLENLRSLFLQNNRITYLNSVDIAKYLRNLIQLNLGGNNFTCDELIEIFHNLKYRVIKGNSFNTHNVHGIQCVDDELRENMEMLRYQQNTNNDGNGLTGDIIHFLLNMKKNPQTKETQDSLNFGKSNISKHFQNLREELESYRNYMENVSEYLENYFNTSLNRSKQIYNHIENIGKYIPNRHLNENSASKEDEKIQELARSFNDINSSLLDSTLLTTMTVSMILILFLLLLILVVVYTKLNVVRSHLIKKDEVELLGS